jgi:PPP family 3-phenylpropionic acid transporter
LLTNTKNPSKAHKPVWKGSLFYLISFISVGSYAPFIYVYFSELGLTGGQVGLLASLAPVMTMLLATPLASLADRTHRRVRIIQAALFGTGVTLFLLRLPTSFNEIAVLMLFMAIFSSPMMSISDSLVARIAQRNNLNYGGMRLWGSLGFALSNLAFGAVWQVLGFKAMFLVGSLLFLPVIWIAGKLEEGPNISRQERQPASHLFRDSGMVLLLIATFLSGIANSLFMTFGGIYTRFLGGGDLLIGMMFAFGALAELPMMFYNERISQRLRGLIR